MKISDYGIPFCPQCNAPVIVKIKEKCFTSGIPRSNEQGKDEQWLVDGRNIKDYPINHYICPKCGYAEEVMK